MPAPAPVVPSAERQILTPGRHRTAAPPRAERRLISVVHGAEPVPTVGVVHPRDLTGAFLAAAGAAGGALLAARTDPHSAVPAALAGGLVLAAAVSWPRAKAWVAWAAAVTAAASLTGTAHLLTTGREHDGDGGLIAFMEVGGLLTLLALVVRWTSWRTTLLVGGATATAVITWILRYLPSYEPLAVVGGSASMAVPATLAIVVGGYPRLAQARLDRSVRSARRAQRLEIAHDLHDYIAHDVTAIVAQAQAARYAFGDDPARLAGTLARIETVGLQALSAMDEMVAVLADAEPAAATRAHPDPGDLPDLVEGFSTERGTCRVDFAQDARAADPAATSWQVRAATHRIVAEALTNVRRHAPAATRVAVTVHVRDDDRLVVTVVNDAGAAGSPRRRASSGTGLHTMRQRVQALGGDLTAGPDSGGRWVLRARLPMRPGTGHG
ncbi:sensor histidine kinase [Dactylosporangium aurantiacum]|nr:histidine kinase [Dactylosporangium aurantiacum]